MSKTVEEVRRAAFEAWAAKKNQDRLDRGFDDFTSWELTIMSLAFNAALDAVEIHLPEPHSTNGGDCVVDYDECRAAIEQTGLGLRVS